ncbi:MAG TPA: CaiB/BaiF CoA-transferase family protein [Solirubrobacteraceae bacterium]|nr:CaiB/BaiF CoA-transferase family protein [Solirubrobacteraceae bacterium]
MGPLEGIRVLDLTRLLPGGFATALLADLGAEVVKVEQPGRGDHMRWDEPRIGGESAHSWVTDRNKASIALNLKDPRGVEALKALARTHDAVIEGFRPGVVDRLGIGYDALRAVNPALVYVSITGYGQTGPMARHAGHDLNYAGRAGVLSITGSADRPPAIPGVQVADIGGGSLMAVVGLLAALVRARATGAGDHVDVAMTDGAFAWLSIHMGDHFADGRVGGPEAMLLNGRFPCYAVYECRDGRHLTVGALEPQFWTRVCRLLGRPELEPTQFDPEALPAWRALFAERARDGWLELLGGPDTCVGPVNDLAEAAADPQLRHRGMVGELEHPDFGPQRQVGIPIKLRNRPGALRTAAPALGEGSRRLLAGAGYGADAIDELLRDGVVAEPTTASA